MKKLFALTTLLTILFSFTACSSTVTNGDYDEQSYDAGYDEGYSQGYLEGKEKAKQDMREAIADDLYALGNEIEKEWGVDPEDAAKILSNYADVPDEVDEEDVPNAIWAIYSYYHGSWKVISKADCD